MPVSLQQSLPFLHPLDTTEPGTPDFTLPVLDGSRPEEGQALVINLFGGPGVGKSTLAARIFAGLKECGVESACPEEHAKLAIWSGQPWLLQQQTILLGRTWETIQALLSKVDVIVVDSPLLLCSVYAGSREPGAFHALCADLHRRSNRINVLLERPVHAAYSERGRMQNHEEALAFDRMIANVLHGHGETAIPMHHSDTEVRALVESICQHLDRPAAFAPGKTSGDNSGATPEWPRAVR